MLRFAGVTVGDGASLRCARCGDTVPPAYAPAAEIAGRVEALVTGWGDAPGPNVMLGGPEPFAHPALPELIQACVRAGVRRIGLETDAGALSAGANASGVLGAGVTQLLVRVLAADPALADELTGRRGLAAAAAEGVARFREAAESRAAAVAVTAHVPLCRHNLDALPATVARLAGWGVDAVRLSAAGAVPPGAEAVVAAACDTGMVNQLWVEADEPIALPESHALHRCRWGISYD